MSASTDPAATQRPLPKGFEAFSCVPFRWLIGSLICFFLAMQGQMLVRQLLVWEMTHSELSLGYINLVVAIPMVVMSFFAGAIIDRVERRRLLMVAQLLIMANESLLLVLIILERLSYPLLLLSSFIMGVLFPFVMPTRAAMSYSLVGRALVPNAMALQSATMNVGRIVGPAVTGALIPLLTLKGAYAVAITLHLLATLATLKLPRSYPEQNQKKSLGADMLYAFTYIGRHRAIQLVLLFGLFPLLLIVPTHSMLVVFAEDVWQVGEKGLGLLMAMVGAGGISGALVVARLSNNKRRVRWMWTAALLFAFFLAGFSLSPSFYLGMVLLLGANLFADIAQTMNNTVVQLLAHNEVRGRMSSMLMLSMGLTPLAVLPVAFAAERFGVAKTMFTACLLILLIFIAFWVFSPTLRRLDKQMREQQDASS
jgi:MFS family permease